MYFPLFNPSLKDLATVYRSVKRATIRHVNLLTDKLNCNNQNLKALQSIQSNSNWAPSPPQLSQTPPWGLVRDSLWIVVDRLPIHRSAPLL